MKAAAEEAMVDGSESRAFDNYLVSQGVDTADVRSLVTSALAYSCAIGKRVAAGRYTPEEAGEQLASVSRCVLEALEPQGALS
jgi:hypothetical protein